MTSAASMTAPRGVAGSIAAADSGAAGFGGVPRMPWLPAPLRTFLGVDARRATDAALVDLRDALGRLPVLSLWAAGMLLALAFAFNGSLRDAAWAHTGIWVALAALVWPFAARLLGAQVSEFERLGLLTVLGLALYVVRILHNPLGFGDHDEFLHWRNVEDILATGQLYATNPLLPISTRYPGLAVVTAALVQTTGLSVFAAGVVVVGVARWVFVLSTYALFRALSRDARLASLGAFLCMASSNFLAFHGQFSYESLAIAVAMFVLAMALHLQRVPMRPFLVGLPLFLAAAVALALTHHLTAYFVLATLGLLTLATLALDRDRDAGARLAILTVVVFLVTVSWQRSAADHTSGYLLPILGQVRDRLLEIVHTGSFGRRLFVSESGVLMPLWQRLVSIAAVALIGLGLLTGTMRTWTLRDPQGGRAWPVVLMVFGASYPLCVALRLDPLTWEAGNRLGTYVFVAVAFVMAHAVAHYWQGASSAPARTRVVASALTVLVIGGALAGAGPLMQRGPYLVAAESRSVEAQGIRAATWAREHLGEGHVVASDRINRLLAATYGRQRVVTSLHDGVDLSPLFLASQFDESQERLIVQVGLEYVVVDERLSTSLPFIGHYVETHEKPEGHRTPVSPVALRKFDGMPSVSRLYDGGDVAIYDVKALGRAR